MITLDSYEGMTELQTKKAGFFQLWGHSVPIYCSKLLGVRRRHEAREHRFP